MSRPLLCALLLACTNCTRDLAQFTRSGNRVRGRPLNTYSLGPDVPAD